MKLALKKLLQAHPSIQVSTLLSGSLSTPSAKGAFVPDTAFQSIQTVTVGSGGATDIEFTSIPATFTHLQVRGIARGTAASNRVDILMRINSDTGNNYGGHQLNGDGSTVTSGTLGGTPPVNYLYPAYVTAANNSASVFGVTVIDILDYANTNKYKTIRSLGGSDINGYGNMLFRSGFWQSASAITSITFSMSNFAEYSQLALYGIKGA